MLALHAIIRQHGLQQPGVGLQRFLRRAGGGAGRRPASAAAAAETASPRPAAAGSAAAVSAAAGGACGWCAPKPPQPASSRRAAGWRKPCQARAARWCRGRARPCRVRDAGTESASRRRCQRRGRPTSALGRRRARRTTSSGPRRPASRPAARHSPFDRPSDARVSKSTRPAPPIHAATAPNGPSTARPAPSAARASRMPMAPPGPAPRGQTIVCGTEAAIMPAITGRVVAKAASRPAMLPSPRCEPIRHAQASNTTPGSSPATPKPCRGRLPGPRPPCRPDCSHGGRWRC